MKFLALEDPIESEHGWAKILLVAKNIIKYKMLLSWKGISIMMHPVNKYLCQKLDLR